MRNFLRISLLSLFVFSCFLLSPQPTNAQDIKSFLSAAGIPGGQIVPPGCTKKPADGENMIDSCGLNQVYQLIVNIAHLILMITGPLLILMFIYGGVLWIIAAGNQEKIQAGKNALQAAVIGIVIILGAWLIVNATILSLTKGEVGSKAQIFGGRDPFTTPQ